MTDKKRLPALLLCFFLGVLGIHRFYVGKIGTGILWLLTGGLVGIGALVDFVMIIVGSFKDKQGNKIEEWTTPRIPETVSFVSGCYCQTFILFIIHHFIFLWR